MSGERDDRSSSRQVACADASDADADALIASLEAASAAGDPFDAVYARLFAARPDFETLFWMDEDGGVRGAMLQRAIEYVLSSADGTPRPAGDLSGERLAHEGYGVGEQDFPVFFEALRDAVCEAAGAAWTPAAESAWARMLAGLENDDQS